jgi:uncharacterized protein DUF1839
MCSPSAKSKKTFVRAIEAASYRRHAIHGEGRVWAETNCYTDLLVELVHGLGYEPSAMLAFTLAIGFEGDQWTFFKPALPDLYALYGLDVQELALWRPLHEHLVEQVERGNPVLVEVDSFYLPDTAGTAYGTAHQKTTIGVNEIDVALKRLGYFHNAGYFELHGDDFVNLLQLDGAPHERVLPPYAEFAKGDASKALRGGALVEASLAQLRAHLARAPRENPFGGFRERFEQDLAWLMTADLSRFHAYSFATLRQYGACFELAETYLRWLGVHGVEALAPAADELHAIAETAKALQFQLARSMARRKPLDLAPIDTMGAAWERAMASLRTRFA